MILPTKGRRALAFKCSLVQWRIMYIAVRISAKVEPHQGLAVKLSWLRRRRPHAFDYVHRLQSAHEQTDPEHICLSHQQATESQQDHQCITLPAFGFQPDTLQMIPERHKYRERGEDICVVESREEEQQREECHIHARVDGEDAQYIWRTALLAFRVTLGQSGLDETPALQGDEGEEDDGQPICHA